MGCVGSIVGCPMSINSWITKTFLVSSAFCRGAKARQLGQQGLGRKEVDPTGKMTLIGNRRLLKSTSPEQRRQSRGRNLLPVGGELGVVCPFVCLSVCVRVCMFQSVCPYVSACVLLCVHISTSGGNNFLKKVSLLFKRLPFYILRWRLQCFGLGLLFFAFFNCPN